MYHGYSYNPDATYARVEKLAEICARYAPNAKLRQGESGCTSDYGDRFSLRDYPWSEDSQAKWDMRRMIGDLGHGVRSSVFSICDLQYRRPYSAFDFTNRKGLLRANADRQVYQVKKAYYAVQNVVAVFDWAGAPLRDHVWVDVFTGAVYEIPAKHQIVHSRGITFVRIPVYDSPCLVTERAALDFVPAGE